MINDDGDDGGIFSLFSRTAKYQQDTFLIMPFERMTVFKDEGEKRQSLISGLKRILIKGRYLDQTEVAWNHLYYSGIQAVSLPAWNSTFHRWNIFLWLYDFSSSKVFCSQWVGSIHWTELGCKITVYWSYLSSHDKELCQLQSLYRPHYAAISQHIS